MTSMRAGLTLLFATFLTACAADPAPAPLDPVAYEQSIQEFRAKREATIAADWVTLVGLAWLHEGENRAGSALDADLALPASAPAHLGTFTWSGERVTFRAADGVAVTLDDQPVREHDVTPDRDVLRAGTLRLRVIRRGERVGLRVWDDDSPARRAFDGLEWMPVRQDLRVEARLDPWPGRRTVPIMNVFGDVADWESPGELVFSLGGEERRLIALLETPDADELFVIFRDGTNGETTYPAGRYFYVPRPANGRVTLDFNKAYSPPCAFTEFATCPLPPRPNWMNVKVEGGELYEEH